MNGRSISVVAAPSVISALTSRTFIGRTTADGKDSSHFHPFPFQPDSLVVSRSIHTGNAGTVQVGQTLPPGCVAQTVAVP